MSYETLPDVHAAGSQTVRAYVNDETLTQIAAAAAPWSTDGKLELLDSIFAASNTIVAAEPTLAEQITATIANTGQTPGDCALRDELDELVARQRHAQYRDVFRTVD